MRDRLLQVVFDWSPKVSRRPHLIVAILGALVALKSSLLLQAQPAPYSSTADAKAELQRAWQQLEAWDDTERTYHVTAEVVGSNSRLRHSMSISVKPQHRCAELDHGIAARSPIYGFLLKRGEADAWTLAAFWETSSDRQAVQAVRKAAGMSASVAWSPLGTFYPLTSLSEFADDSFTVDRVTPQQGNLVRFDFRRGDTTGFLVADQSRSMCVIQSELHAQIAGAGKVVTTTRRELFDEPSRKGVPRCKSYNLEARDAHGKILTSVLLNISNYSDEPVPDRVFRLSNYGLPEPIGHEAPKRTPTYIWLLLGVGLFGVLAIGLRYIARNMRNKSSK